MQALKGVPLGTIKESTNIKLDLDSVLLFQHTEDNDPDGSFLVYILEKILKQKGSY